MSALTIFRIREEVTDPDKILVDRDKLEYSPVKLEGRRIADLYLRRIERGKPAWLKYFGNAIDLAGVSVRTASLAAVCLVKQDDVLYALVFGYGRSLIAEGVIDRRFGLRATLNAVEPSQLHSIDHKRLDAVARHTRVQLSKAGGLDQFGLDTDRDLLRAVTGNPTDAKHGRRLSGADQLTVAADIPLNKLAESLTIFGKLADERTYVAHFPWVDKVKDIRDPLLESTLEKKLLKEMAAGKANAWLAPPEIIDWVNTTGFSYHTRKSAIRYDHLDLDNYFAEYGRPKTLSPMRLQQDRIYHLRTEADAGTHSWSVLNCLVAECDHDGRRFVLNEGTWYEIDTDFCKR